MKIVHKEFKLRNLFLLFPILLFLFIIIGKYKNYWFILTTLVMLIISLILAFSLKTKNFFLYYLLPLILIGKTKNVSFKFVFMEFTELMALYAMIIFFILFLSRKKYRELKTGLELPLITFLIFCFLSLLNSYMKLTTLSKILLLLMGFGFYYISFYAAKNRCFLDELKWILVILGTFTAIVSVVQLFSLKIFQIIANPLLSNWGVFQVFVNFIQYNRITGLWQQHNLANIFNFFIPLCYAIILSNKKLVYKLLAGICAFIMILALLLTNTRINIIVFLTIAFIFFLLTKKKFLFCIIILLIIMPSIFMYLNISDLGFERFESGKFQFKKEVYDSSRETIDKVIENIEFNQTSKYYFYEEKIQARYDLPAVNVKQFNCKRPCLNLECDYICMPIIDYIPQEEKINKYTNGRIWHVRRGLELFSLYPLTGIGLGNSKIYRHITDPPRGILSTQNIFIEILASLGIFGFLAFLWLLGKTFKNDIQLLFKGRLRNDPLLLAFSLGSLTLLIDGLTQNGLFYWQFNAVFWIYRGVIHAVNLKKIK